MGLRSKLLVCATLECESKEEMMSSMEKAKGEGADLVELCIDSMSFSHISEVEHLLKRRTLPSIVSFRQNSARSAGIGDSRKACLQVLRRAIELDVEFVEIELEVASDVVLSELMNKRSNTKIIVSSYLNGGTPSKEKLGNLIACLQCTRADIVKVVIDVVYITDVAPLFHVLAHCQVPLIARAVGDRGLISQLLGPKYGALWVWGSLGGNSIPGLPSLVSIKQVYKLDYVNADTKVFGVISNPVSHSKGPLLHNPAFRHTGYNGVYVPLLVDNIKEFFRVFSCNDFAGFSVGIPHKEAAVRCCDEVHPLAKVNGQFFRALTMIFSKERAKALAEAVSGEALPIEHLDKFCPENGMILANASAVGMQPNTSQTPVSKEALESYELVFDAVYTPRNTRLLQEAAEVGATVVSGAEMFVRQALGQFKLFTDGLAPEDFMRKVVLEQF
ncbi:hypothetical protein RJ640_019843 [Escallonia rubra]|uniref:Uncharacterized protein n=1 Tax=Escallonia rubra TaxID=112253 RepID=A0AA88RTB7_9ASTE|nr:hypothetical protein RJ640_019843 [Escallonia rubra]